MLGPIVQRGGVEVRTIRPNQGVHFGVDRHAVEHLQFVRSGPNSSPARIG